LPLGAADTVEELGRLKDSRAIDLLERLIAHADRLTRLRAVLALGQFDDPSIPPAMARVVEADSAAANVLARYSVR